MERTISTPWINIAKVFSYYFGSMALNSLYLSQVVGSEYNTISLTHAPVSIVCTVKPLCNDQL